MDQIVLVATWLMLGYAIVGSVDGVYYHLYKFKLYAHPESRYEHILHTIRVLTFPLVLLLLFVKNYGGIYLWFGTGLVIVDLLVETLDIYSEEMSRKHLGGLPRTEYYIHMMTNGLHFSSMAMIIAAKPLFAWKLNSETVLSPYPEFTSMISVALIPGIVILFILHVYLYLFPQGKLKIGSY